MQLKERIDSLVWLGQQLANPSEALEARIRQTKVHNGWFTEKNIHRALASIRQAFLEPTGLEAWATTYALNDTLESKKVALILAGNIPMVGFHDVLCVYMAGHQALVKLSEKDKFLLPYLVQLMDEQFPGVREQIQFVTKLGDYDAVIATGSNNSARYFESYFGKYPHIIRRNRNGVAVLSGEETTEELNGIADDVLAYFGLGCRNVSKVYLPQNYAFEPLLEALHEHRELALHNKYKNNFDYNYTLLILNKVAYQANGCVLMIEAPELQSRIASIHFEYYADEATLEEELKSRVEEIQCIVSAKALPSVKTIAPGTAQKPRLQDYADGVDTMQFLLGL